MSEAEKLKDLYCKWCSREQRCDNHLTLEEKRACLACSGFVDELLKAGYLLVEPVQLEVLDDKEIEGVDIRQTLNFAEYAKAIS